MNSIWGVFLQIELLDFIRMLWSSVVSPAFPNPDRCLGFAIVETVILSWEILDISHFVSSRAVTFVPDLNFLKTLNLNRQQ